MGAVRAGLLQVGLKALKTVGEFVFVVAPEQGARQERLETLFEFVIRALSKKALNPLANL